jgi:hypothetical protein
MVTIDVSEFTAQEIEDLKAHIRGRTDTRYTYFSH